MARLNAVDWVQAGLDALRDAGPAYLSAENLSKSLGISRGSFYHHFESTEDFYSKMLVKWKEDSTLSIIQKTDETDLGSRNLDLLLELVSAVDHRLDRAVRIWGFTFDPAKKAVAKVDSLRIEHTQKLLNASYEPKSVAGLGEIFYRLFVGHQLSLETPGPAIKRSFQQLGDMLCKLLER